MTTQGGQQAPSLEHWLLHYKEKMHRPFTKLIILLEDSSEDSIPRYIEEALNNKSIYAMAGVNGTTSPYFLNAVVKFDDILENEIDAKLFQEKQQH